MLAILRDGEPIAGNLANVPLAVDDVLLVQGSEERMSAMPC